jgi:hypothetical protein|nr:MAG TPA: hypothetical protein [Caudoviricetes sp.]
MNDMMSPADVVALTNRNNDGMFGGNGAWWIIILFLFAFVGWGGNGWGGNGNSGAADNYVLASDFATVQRMISDATNSLERRLDNTQNGLCDLGYTQAQLINGVQVGQMQQGYETRIAVNGVGQKLSDCCCDIKQEIAGVNNGLGRAIERGFCDTNYNMQAQHNATMIAIDKVGDRVIDYLNSTRMQDLQAENQALRLAASQQAQNNYLVSTLRPTPVPSYQVQNPYCCNNVCSCGSF